MQVFQIDIDHRLFFMEETPLDIADHFLIERIFIICRNGVGLRRIVRGVLNCDQVLRGGTDGLNDAVVDHAVLEEIVPDAVIQGVLTGDLCKCVRPQASHAQRKCEKECKNPHKYSFSVAKY